MSLQVHGRRSHRSDRPRDVAHAGRRAVLSGVSLGAWGGCARPRDATIFSSSGSRFWASCSTRLSSSSASSMTTPMAAGLLAVAIPVFAAGNRRGRGPGAIHRSNVPGPGDRHRWRGLPHRPWLVRSRRAHRDHEARCRTPATWSSRERRAGGWGRGHHDRLALHLGRAPLRSRWACRLCSRTRPPGPRVAGSTWATSSSVPDRSSRIWRTRRRWGAPARASWPRTSICSRCWSRPGLHVRLGHAVSPRMGALRRRSS